MSFFLRRVSPTQDTTQRKARRPEGVSRRRRRELTIETLEDRRVMSAQSLVNTPQYETTSYSSNTAEGQAAILAQELARYLQQTSSAAATNNDYVSYAIPTDPLLNLQWHLINTGQQVGSPDFQNIFGVAGEDIGVAGVWNQDIFGDGVTVGVFELDTFQTTHPDLAGNVDPLLSFLFGPSEGDHATAVAGLIGAIANNGIGGSGVAPGATLVPMSGVNTPGAIEAAFRFAMENDIDVVNNSWGPAVVRGLAGPSDLEFLALSDAVSFGRDELGTIFVFAAGNSGKELDTAAYNGFVNSRYVIGVTGVDHDGQYNNVDGTVTGYPETSAAVLVSAPTGSNTLRITNDFVVGSGIITTDLIGEDGYNGTGFAIDRDFQPDTNYTSLFNGTSAAAPQVSGVVALMLEANPNLSWRDVQEILVRSARQNAEISTQGDGYDVSLGIEYQNTWIVNQVPLFHDPDLFDPLIPFDIQVMSPTLNPLLTYGGSGSHYQPTPQGLTNGAGYTVSQGRGTDGEQWGYAHGVVDAELAVELAKQWTTKGQHLADELTFTTTVDVPYTGFIPAAELVENIQGPNTPDMIIPGGLGGDNGFSAYWQEYINDSHNFNQTFPARGQPFELTVPETNNMAVESVEVTITVDGNMGDFMDNVRMVLVSPSGTHSELNYYFVDEGLFDPDNFHQAEPVVNSLGGLGGLRANGFDGVSDPVDFLEPGSVNDIQEFTFTTKRIWGERSDDALIVDPTTGLPYSGFAGNIYNVATPSLGNLLTQGWRIYFENYGTTDIQLEGVEITWHGSPLEENTERIQGLIGIDEDQNDAFNWSRVIDGTGSGLFDLDLDTSSYRLGEVVHIVDPAHESMAENITVTVTRDSDGAIVDQFVTGADGNFYFDLVPDFYTISIDDPLDRVALQDNHTPDGFIREYQTAWHITPEHFTVWNRVNGLTPVDVDGVPEAFDDGSGVAVTYGMTGINFLLDPGPPAAPQVEFSGVVSADFNGDGLFNGNDVAVPNVRVYADVNRNGALDSGEIVVQTNANGQYNLIVPNTVATVMNVGVVAPVNWTFSDPASGVEPIFVEPGDVFTGINFAITPPLGASAGDGSTNAGYLMGVVYSDANNNGSRQATETGIQGIQVFIDANNNGTREVNEALTTTNANGAFIFGGVAPGTHRVRALPTAPLVSINPGPGVPRIVNLAGGGTTSQIEFGVGLGSNPQSGSFDYGDLPSQYGITLQSENGARHTASAYYLGLPGSNDIDVDTDGKPSADAGKAGTSGDDQVGGDEDGIVVDPLIAGATGHLVANASRQGGNLQGWIDFNGDYVFQPEEKVISNVALVAGANDVYFQIPATLAASTSATGGKIFARFRYGEYGINSVTGPAAIGEVEDYLLDRDPSSLPAVIEHGPDFNEDGLVNGRDFLIWQRNNGRTNALGTQGDANGDGIVGYPDLVMWRNYYGTTAGSYSAFTADDDEAPAALAVDDTQVSNDLAVMTDESPAEEGKLVEAILIVDTAAASYISVAEVSAQASTSVTPLADSLAGAVKLWLDAQDDTVVEDEAVSFEEEEIDGLFGDSNELVDLALALRSRESESTAYRVSDEDSASESDENNAFELAFAEADWLQF